MKKTDVLKYVDPQKVIRLAQELVRIPSENPPGNEQEVARFVQGRLQKIGLETKIVEPEKGRSNVIAEYKKEPKLTLILNGHADVVPAGDGWSYEPYGGQIKFGRLYGRGAADMKGGLAAAISAVDAVLHLRQSEPFIVESILGTRFTGRIKGTTRLGKYDAVIPQVEGRAWITGRNEFLISPNDPLKEGFTLR